MGSERRLDLAALALLLFAMARIASTWTTFSSTADEPMHVSAGLELLTRRTYTYQPENPPLPRAILAIAPLLGGMRFDPDARKDEQLLHVFYSNDRYRTNLVLARCGNLFFFALGTLAVWWWARRELGAAGGLVAMLLFTTQPAILAHAGLATVDMAATASVAVALLAFLRWMEVPSIGRAVAFGAACAFAVLCKFSAIGYVPAACLAMFLCSVGRRRPRRRSAGEGAGAPPSYATAVAALPTLAFVLWAGYGFHLRPFLDGIRGLRAVDDMYYFAYLFGEVSPRGWPYYFPIALALKATLASLLLALGARRKELAAALAILAVAMTSHLNLGVRHILPLFAPLTIAAAATALRVPRIATIALLAWHTGASLVAHPDTLPYFNELAGRRPWRCLLDSNFDWGQDVLRLQRVVREKKIDRIGIAILGWHDYDALGFPPHYEVNRAVPSQGWIAISEHMYSVARAAPWLAGRRYERVGKSIRLYYVP